MSFPDLAALGPLKLQAHRQTGHQTPALRTYGLLPGVSQLVEEPPRLQDWGLPHEPAGGARHLGSDAPPRV